MEIEIHDGNWDEHYRPVVDGYQRRGGLLLRDMEAVPHGSVREAPAFDLPLLPESEWPDRLAEKIKNKAQISDARNRGNGGQPIPSRDQNGIGYCWCHSGTSAALIVRALMNQPYVDLSAFAVGCMIKDYQDQGGNGIQGVEFIATKGIPTSQFWAQQSRSRSNDNPQTWANAALHRFTNWRDMDPAQMKAQLVTSLLLNIPVVADFNWWGHSVLACDLVSLNPFSIRIWNSWGDAWSENGMGVLTGSKALPNNGVACLTETLAAA